MTREPCLRVAAGSADAVDYLFSEALSSMVNDRSTGVCASAQPTLGTAVNLKLLEEGAADLAIVRANELYAAYIDGSLIHPRPHSHLRGMAVIYPSVLHIIVRSDSPVRARSELKNARLGAWVPKPGGVSPAVRYADLLAAAGAEDPSSLEIIRMPFPDLSRALESGTIAGAFINAAHPNDAVADLARTGGIRFLEFGQEAADRIRAQYPFFKHAVIPPGTYHGQDDPVSTIAVDNLLVARVGLDRDAVYQVTKTLLEDLPKLTREHGFAALVNPDLAPATSIPLHPGASRYYRERELLQ